MTLLKCKKSLNCFGIQISDSFRTSNLIFRYVNRNEEEMEQLKSQHRKGRPKPVKLEKLEMIQSQDRAEYESGFELPDLRQALNVEKLRKWEGDFNGIASIGTVTITFKDKPQEDSTQMIN